VADLGIRYASALFEISNEGGRLNEYLEQAEFLRHSLKDEGALAILTHPRITAAEKYAFLGTTFEGKLDPDFFNFLKLVVSKNREAYIVPALDRLVDMIRDRRGETTARVVSAVPLSDEQAARLAAVLSEKLGKKVDMTVLVDPTVIAGISIHVDGFFFDRTVKTMLKGMKESVRRGADE